MDAFLWKSRFTLLVLVVLLSGYGVYAHHEKEQARLAAEARERIEGYDRCSDPIKENFPHDTTSPDYSDRVRIANEAIKGCRDFWFGKR